MTALCLISSRGGGRLEIQEAPRDRWRIELSQPDLSAAAVVEALAYGGEHTLGVFFRRLADDWRGWGGERTWAALEGDFELRASHDGLGHIALRVVLRSGPYDDDWTVAGTIWLDAGQLDALARQAATFVGTL